MLRRLVGICACPHDCCHIVPLGIRSCSVLRFASWGQRLAYAGSSPQPPCPPAHSCSSKPRADPRAPSCLRRRTDRTLGGESENLRTALSRHQGVDHGGFSNVLDKKIEQQLKDDKLEVDAAIFQTLQDFVRRKAEDHLLNYKPQGFDAIDPSFKDPDGAFYGTMVIAMPYMVNTEHVSSAD